MKVVKPEDVKNDHRRYLGYLDEDMITRLNLTLDKNVLAFQAIPLDKVKQAREDIEQLKHKATDVEGYRWWNNAIENCLYELDKLIAESEG